ncbi:MAG: amidase [Candidatus Eisenbacteria bacterium]|nr:amidase [Candidatus Eisenbacteria bacterium]
MRGNDDSKCSRTRFSRRGFLKAGLSGGMMAAAFPAFAGIGGSVTSTSKPRSPDLEEITIFELAEGMRSGRHTARSITEKYLERIEALDRKGPALRSVIEVNPDALAIADALDKERKGKGPRGPMHGIPVLIKDNIDTMDRMATTAGSLALIGAKPPADAFLVQRLRSAGAVILGKTNPSEWANIRSSHSTSGWSGRGGLTKNPYALDRNPSGSSSGSAVAVAANLCPVAVGTETDGSIVSPSSASGIVGLKPTVGLVSRTGVIPISHTQDTAGPMARTVRDAAVLLGALTGADPEDGVTAGSQGKSFADYTQFLDPKGLEGSRIGVVRKSFGFHETVDIFMSNALDVLKQHGATLVDPADIETLDQIGDSELTVLLYELKADLSAYFNRLGPDAPVHSLKDVILFNERNKRTEMPYFGQDLFEKSEAKGPLTDKEYLDALEKDCRLTRTEGIDAVMDKFKLDALVAPTGAPAWLTDLVNGDHYVGGSSTAAAVAGYPSITVPAGCVVGLPIGISFFGRAWSEPVLIKLAHAFEKATRFRKPPRFLPTADLRA